MKPILEVRQLTVQVGQKVLLNNVSFDVEQGKITALVGGSGSGKTTIANAILGLLPSALERTNGQVLFENKNLFLLDSEHMRRLRGKSISMIFQEPLSTFNPLMTIYQQLDEVLLTHTHLDAHHRENSILEALARVGLENPRAIAKRYPHQLSGGQRQRAMIAQAIITEPKLIIADEPTSNLDVILQARIMDVLRELRAKGMTMILISHDLGMVSHLAEEIVILQKGVVVESGSTASVMKTPQHKYTRALMEAFA